MGDRGCRVLVAGGAGFLGRHLVAALMGRGAQVTVLDSFLTSDPEVPLPPGVALVRACVTRPQDWPAALAPELIFNLACPASPKAYQRDPVLTLESSVLGARALAHLALERGARLVQASTSEVYGDPQVHPQPEGYAGHVPLSGPRACYDEGKRAAEVLLRDLAGTRGLDLRIARIFNTYGPGMAADDGRVVSAFVAQALAGAPLTVFGDGSQTRSFCHVDDMIAGLMLLARSDIAGPEPVNLGNPEEVTVLDLARLVCRLAGSAAPIEHAPLPLNDPARRCPDIARARRVLDFEPRIGLEEGLRRTIAAMSGD